MKYISEIIIRLKIMKYKKNSFYYLFFKLFRQIIFLGLAFFISLALFLDLIYWVIALNFTIVLI